MNAEDERRARAVRAAARRVSMTGEIVSLGQPKPSPYVGSTPEERLATAVRLIEHHQALRGDRSTVPRSQWPGAISVADGERG